MLNDVQTQAAINELHLNTLVKKLARNLNENSLIKEKNRATL